MSIKSYFKGKFQEIIVDIGLFIGLDKKEYQVHSNVTLELLDEITTQIDHVIVSKYGIFVIETKNYKGWIYGSQSQKIWTRVLFNRKNPFQNPLRQNYKHIKFLQALLSIPEVMELKEEDFKSIIYFSEKSTFKTDMPPNIMQKGLVPYIKDFKEIKLNDIRIKKLNERLANKRLEVSIFTDIKHVENLKKQFKDEALNEKIEVKQKKKKTSLYALPIILICTIVLIFAFISPKKEYNPLLGEWLQDVQFGQIQNAIFFSEDTIQMNSQKLKTRYEIKDNIILVKPTVYGITGLVPSFKFKVIDQNTILQEIGSIKIKYIRGKQQKEEPRKNTKITEEKKEKIKIEMH